MLYPAFVELGDKNRAYGVVLPDFPGYEMNDLPARVQEAVELYFEGENLPLPPPSDLTTLRTRPEFAYDGLWMLFDIDTSRLTTRAKRFNATLPENLLAAIDDYVKTLEAAAAGFWPKPPGKNYAAAIRVKPGIYPAWCWLARLVWEDKMTIKKAA